jgi:hypothetical protein
MRSIRVEFLIPRVVVAVGLRRCHSCGFAFGTPRWQHADDRHRPGRRRPLWEGARMVRARATVGRSTATSAASALKTPRSVQRGRTAPRSGGCRHRCAAAGLDRPIVSMDREWADRLGCNGPWRSTSPWDLTQNRRLGVGFGGSERPRDAGPVKRGSGFSVPESTLA